MNVISNTPKIAVVTSGGANFYSIEIALQRLNVNYQLTTDKAVIERADGIIFPGVGTADHAMRELAKHDLIETLCNYKKPLLGICLGMQLLYEFSAEGNVACLGVLPGKVCQFPTQSPHGSDLIVPHMGWNNLAKCKDSRLLSGIDLVQDVYFVHSYYVPVTSVTVASCNYGIDFAAITQQDNFYAMQFHPEKSGKIGAQLLENFIGIVKAGWTK